MRYMLFPVLALSLSFLGCGQSGDRELSAGLSAIDAHDLTPALMYLASDSLKGRNTPSPELDSAASYIALAFARAGLQPAGNTYRQPFNVSIVDLAEPNTLSLSRNGKEIQYELKTDFVPFEMTANRAARGQLVFAGYGITAPEYGYDDYSGI